MSQPQSGVDGVSVDVTGRVVNGDGAVLDPDSELAQQALAASAAGVSAALSGERPPGDTSDDSGGTGGSSGSGGSSAGTGGGTGAIAPLPITLFGVFPGSSTLSSGPGGTVRSETEPERRPTQAVAEFNQHDELANVIATAARQRVAPAQIIDMRITPEGSSVEQLAFPAFERKSLFRTTVATSEAAADALIERAGDDAVRLTGLDAVFAGMAAKPVNRGEKDRQGFLTADGDQIVNQVLRGMAAEQVRGGELPEGLLERRGMMPENLAQFKYEALRGAQAVAARPRPPRRDPIMDLARSGGPFVVPNSKLDAMNEAFPHASTSGFDDSLAGEALAGEILAKNSELESLIIARELGQRTQREKLESALKVLWAEQHELVRNWDGSQAQQDRLAEVMQRIGTLTGLVQLNEHTQRELDVAYHATQSASAAVASAEVSATDMSAVAEVNAAIELAKGVTSTAEGVAAEAADQAGAATEVAVSADPALEVAAQDWASAVLQNPEPPEELLAGLRDGVLPAEWLITDANPETGEFTLTREPLMVDLDSARSPDSTIEHEGLSLDDAVTAEGTEAQSVKVVDGDFEALGTAPVEDAAAPVAQPAARHTAAGMRLQPGDDSGDEGGSGTAASAARRRRSRHGIGPVTEGVDAVRLMGGGNGDDSGDDRAATDESKSEPGKKPVAAAAKAEQLRKGHLATTGPVEMADDAIEVAAPGEVDAATASATTEVNTLEPEAQRVEPESSGSSDRDDVKKSAVKPATNEGPDREPVDARYKRAEHTEVPKVETTKPDATDAEAPAEPKNAKPESTAEVVAEDVSETSVEDPKPSEAEAGDQPDQAPVDGEQPTEDKAERPDPVDGEQPPPDQDARPEGAEPVAEENAGPPQPEDGAAPAKNDSLSADGEPVNSGSPQVEPGPNAGAAEPNQPLSGPTVDPGAPMSGNRPVSGRPQAAGPQLPHQPSGPPGMPARTAVPGRSASHPGAKGAYGGPGAGGKSTTAVSGTPLPRTAR